MPRSWDSEIGYLPGVADAGDSTLWTMIRGAADGRATDRAAFAALYEPAIRAYLHARWGSGWLQGEIDDAVQEAFVECLKDDGVLTRVDPNRRGGFRAYLYGVLRNVALRIERRTARRQARTGASLPDADRLRADEPTLSRVFDRAWAIGVLQRASVRMTDRATGLGGSAPRRGELLRLRFGEGLPIREIAARWDADPARVHRQYAKARAEYRRALEAEVAALNPGSPEEIERECESLLAFFA